MLENTNLKYQIFPLPGEGPEDVVFGPDKAIYTGLADGRLLRISPETETVNELTQITGRPLGLETLPDGKILICNSPEGLQCFNPRTSVLETLVTHDGADKLIFCSNVVAAPDGDIYFTVSTMRYNIHHWRKDIAEKIPTGRLYHLSKNKTLTKLKDKIFFANGLVRAKDGSHLIIAETGGKRLIRYWLAGPQKGQSETFATLPGYPDNLGQDAHGNIWVAMASEQNAILETVHTFPFFLRQIIGRLPDNLQPSPTRMAWVIAFNSNGQIIHDLKSKRGDYAMITGVCRDNGDVWCGSLGEKSLLKISMTT